MRDQYTDFTALLAGVIFFSTPHTGSGIASLARYLKIIRATPLVEELTKNQASLRDLDDWYRNHAVERKLPTLSFFEKQNTKRIRVVDESSGDPHLPGMTAIPVDADHRTVCKFPDRTSPIYLQVRRFLTAQARQHVRDSIGRSASHPATANVQTPRTPPGTTESNVERDSRQIESLEFRDDTSVSKVPANSKTHQACKLVAEWIASTLVNHGIHFSRFQFKEAQGESTAEAFRLGMNDRARLSVNVSSQSDNEYALSVTVSSTHRGSILSRATRLPDLSFDERAVIFLTRDLWPELAPSLDYLLNL
jgi:hypothetical protein